MKSFWNAKGKTHTFCCKNSRETNTHTDSPRSPFSQARVETKKRASVKKMIVFPSATGRVVVVVVC